MSLRGACLEPTGSWSLLGAYGLLGFGVLDTRTPAWRLLGASYESAWSLPGAYWELEPAWSLLSSWRPGHQDAAQQSPPDIQATHTPHKPQKQETFTNKDYMYIHTHTRVFLCFFCLSIGFFLIFFYALKAHRV